MRLAQINLENAAIWVYPDAFPDASRQIAIDLPEPNRLRELWKVINSPASGSSIFQVHYLTEKSTGRRKEDDSLVHIDHRLVHDLASIQQEDRWKLAQNWCQLRLQTKCNKEAIAKHKYLFAALCDLAQQALSASAVLAVVQDEGIDAD